MHYKRDDYTPPTPQPVAQPEQLDLEPNRPLKIVALSDIDPPKPYISIPRDYSVPLDPPSFIFAFGFGGVFMAIENNEYNYSHGIGIGNTAPLLKTIPYVRFLHYFPGPLVPGAVNTAALHKFIIERGKCTLLWEVI
jgi:hypothetical protein